MLKFFSELPEHIQNFLVDATGPEWAEKIVVGFGLPKEKIIILLDIAERSVLEIDLLGILPSVILSELEVNWNVARQIAIDLAGNRLLPIASFLNEDIEARIREWGGDSAKFKDVPRLAATKEDSTDVVSKILAELEINLVDKLEQSRLEFILNSLVSGARTKEETLAAFCRPVKVGGLNMDPDDANGLLDRFLQKINPPQVRPSPPTPLPTKNRGERGEVRQMTDIKPPVIPPVSVAKPSSLKMTPLPSTPLMEGEDYLPPRQEGEGQKREGEGKTWQEGEGQKKEKLSLEEIVKTIEQKADLKFDEPTRKKFVGAVEARFKDIRDAFETRDLLERSVDQGGLAIGGGQLSLIMEELEKIVGEQQTLALSKTEADKKVAKEAAKAEMEKLAAEKAKAARPKISPPKPVAPMVSSASRSLPPSNGRPMMVDVVAPNHKLSGPVDELQNLSLEEFRRLSSDPKEAIIKIHDKISLLEEQGISQKILAVKAWRSSPINLLYLEISRAALLSGRTTEDVTRERLAANQPSLTNQEIQAINSLNGMLRF